ncbi:MAG TPA: type II toxin-antitoxin system VapC family toxin [Opitutaceae bacterium]
MLLLDTSLLIEYERELVARRIGAARRFLGAYPLERPAISLIAWGEFAEGFADRAAFGAFISGVDFTVVQLSQEIAWRMASLQGSIGRRLGENDAWIAATAQSARPAAEPGAQVLGDQIGAIAEEREELRPWLLQCLSLRRQAKVPWKRASRALCSALRFAREPAASRRR